MKIMFSWVSLYEDDFNQYFVVQYSVVFSPKMPVFLVRAGIFQKRVFDVQIVKVICKVKPTKNDQKFHGCFFPLVILGPKNLQEMN